MVLAGIEDLAAQEVEQPPRPHLPGRALADMVGDRPGHVPHREARRPGPGAEVGILPVDEEARVEPAERPEQVAADHQEGAHHLVDGAVLRVVPFAQEVRPHEAQAVQRQGAADEAQRRGRPRAGARGPPVRIDEPRADDPGPPIGRQGGQSHAERVGRDLRVRVQEQDRGGVAGGGALVAGPAEAEIRGVLDQPERAGQGGQGLGGAVRGGVVHHGDLHGRGVPRGREAREAGAQQRAAVPVDDHHVEGRAVGHGRSRGGPRRPRAPSRAAARSLSSTAGRQPESAQYSPAWSGR
ncbi:hypothetical protein AU375_05811 [Methylobacterium radiotolerans]|nr:hypothetical protein AU375_05811 [Methylobacterium radiotolerans]